MAKRLYTAEETAARFQSLPQTVKDLLYSFEMTSIITKIGEKNGLHLDQMDTLNTETAQVMMGLTETQDFPAILMEDLSIDQAKADALAKDVNDMLFIKVRESMKGAAAPTPAPISAPAAVSSASPSMKPSLASVIPLNTTAPAVPPAPIATPAAPAPTATASMPAVKVDMHPADIALNEKTVAVAPTVPSVVPAAPASKNPDTKAVPPKPTNYKADPYREPIN